MKFPHYAYSFWTAGHWHWNKKKALSSIALFSGLKGSATVIVGDAMKYQAQTVVMAV